MALNKLDRALRVRGPEIRITAIPAGAGAVANAAIVDVDATPNPQIYEINTSMYPNPNIPTQAKTVAFVAPANLSFLI